MRQKMPQRSDVRSVAMSPAKARSCRRCSWPRTTNARNVPMRCTCSNCVIITSVRELESRNLGNPRNRRWLTTLATRLSRSKSAKHKKFRSPRRLVRSRIGTDSQQRIPIREGAGGPAACAPKLISQIPESERRRITACVGIRRSLWVVASATTQTVENPSGFSC